MIPTLLLVGIVAGGSIGRHGPVRLAVVGAAASSLWALAVGAATGTATALLGGAALALANVAVGAVVGLGLHEVLRALRRRAELTGR